MVTFCHSSSLGSRALSSNLWFSSEYSGNNAWIYNGTNGNLNNNNKMNSNGVRGVLDFINKSNDNEEVVIFIAELIEYYKITRKSKRSKATQIIFENFQEVELIKLAYELITRTYEPYQSICFMIRYPKLRECIAANFRDRIVQTYIVKSMMPYLETYYHKDSYSCRKYKGALRAIIQFIEYIYEESNGYTEDCWIYKMDYKSFFMSIDTNLFVPKFIEYIKDNYIGPDKELLIYMSEKTFYHQPQKDCIIHSPLYLWEKLDSSKSLLEKFNGIGIPLGNVTSQMMCNFVTTELLLLLVVFGIKFVHYTDDNGGATKNPKKFLEFRKDLMITMKDKHHLELHPNKFYFQHFSKGIEILGYRLKYDKILLSRRVLHNMDRNIHKRIRRATRYPNYIYMHKEDFMNTVNSYMGHAGWTHSFKFRKEMLEDIKNSRWSEVFDFDEKNYLKVNVKKQYTLKYYYLQKNKEEKIQRATW